MKRIVLCDIFLLIAILSVTDSMADEQKAQMNSSAPKKRTGVQDKLTELEIRIKNQEKAKSKGGKSSEAKIFAPKFDNLKNPFLPQLPKESAVPVPTPPKNNDPGNTSRPISDPMRSKPQTPAPPAVTLPKVLEIQGIIWNSERPQAIIDNQVVDIGEMLDSGVKILSIGPTEIEVLYKDTKFKISTEESNNKK